MKIGVDASCWTNRRGFGRFTRELLWTLLELDDQAEYCFLIDRQSAPHCRFPPRASRVVVSTNQSQSIAASADGYRSLPDILRMSWTAARAGCDLFFFPAVYSYFPVLPGCKIIVTFHDAIAERHPALIFPTGRARLFWYLKSKLARQQADFILTVSRNARDVLIRQWKLNPDRVRFVREAASPIFKPVQDRVAQQEILSQFRLTPETPYLIYVGGISPHKNLAFLVDVFGQIITSPSFAATKLLLVGDYEKDGFYSSFPELSRLLQSHRLGSSVILTGYVADEKLVHLYNKALALVLPSLDEGFGLPAVEAMACGIPVIASRAGSLPEVVGDAGLLFDPRSPDELADALRSILDNSDRRNDLAERARQRGQEFSWKKAAEEVKDLFQEALSS